MIAIFLVKITIMVNAQEWLDKEYPLNRRNEVTELDIRKGKVKRWDGHERNLKGDLRLAGFTNLRTLIVSLHQLTSLDLNDCSFLTELNCHSNQLNSLHISDCSNLEKIDCSNNHLYELTLTNNIKLKEINLNSNNFLEEVDIRQCPELIKVGFGFTRDKKRGRLVKISQTELAGDKIRNILVIGITGNGKSALSNVLAATSETNQFGEKSSSTSVTKNFQTSDFVWEKAGKKVKYRIIDNIGFADTNNIAKEDILFKIGEGIHSAKEGINQVLFVFKGRFAPEHVKVFNLFKDFISETGIASFTTLVRTNFENFRNSEECEADRNVLLTQSPELVEIINSCNDIIYVDNPSLPIIETDDDVEEREEKKEEISINNERREVSRKIVLDHLVENCSKIYKLKNWDSIHQQVSNCMQKIAEDEEKLTKSDNAAEKHQLQNKIKENKGKVVEEVNAKFGIELSLMPKFTAEVLMNRIHPSQFFTKK